MTKWVGERSVHDGTGIGSLESGDDTVARVEVTFIEGQAPFGAYEQPTEGLAAAKGEFGTSRIQRWFGRDWHA